MTKVLLIAVAASLFTMCDALAADWAKNGRTRSLLLVLALGPIAYLTFGYLAKKTPLALVGGYVNVAIVVGTTLVGVVLFGDALSTRQWCGIGLAIAGLVLMAA